MAGQIPITCDFSCKSIIIVDIINAFTYLPTWNLKCKCLSLYQLNYCVLIHIIIYKINFTASQQNQYSPFCWRMQHTSSARD